jgi:NAD(P)H-hydrate epimerase
MAKAWRAVGGQTQSVNEFTEKNASLTGTIVVDAMYGTGLTRPLGGDASALAELSRQATLVVALDVPSGFCADRGIARGACVRADLTVTFGTSKPGLHTGDASEFAGQISVIPLGASLPDEVLRHATHRLVTAVSMAPRPANAHKGSAGRVLVLGGCSPFVGAGVLCSMAAHCAGAGLVTLARHQATAPTASLQPETMLVALAEDPAVLAAQLNEISAKSQCIVVGPGLGLTDWARAVVAWARNATVPVVFDGDALTILAADVTQLPERSVLTPHPLEAARLLGLSSAREIQADRHAAVTALAERYRACVVLKGAGTLISAPSQALCSTLPFATAALGVAGSGDVLAGMIAARIAEAEQHAHLIDVVATACWLHGRAGEQLAQSTNTARGVLASEIALQARVAMAEAELRFRTHQRLG